MSLDKMKEEIRKKKLSIDEAYDHKSVGNPEIRPEDRKKDNKPVKKEDETSYHFPSRQGEKTKTKMDFKLTFNVNSDTFKAFNEIYAERMIYDEKTEKSVLICEAIRLLYESEKEKRKKLK